MKSIAKESKSICKISCVTVPAFHWDCFESISRQEFQRKFPIIREEHVLAEEFFVNK